VTNLPTEPLRIKFTKHAVAAVTLPPGKDDQVAWNVNLPTCGVRMRRGQKGITKTYIVQPTGKPKIIIGDVRKFTPEAAEKIARQLLAKIALGGEPGAEKKKAKLATSTSALTFGKVADRYRAVRNWSPRTAEQAALYLGKRAERLRSRLFTAIQRADAAAWLQELSGERGRMAAKTGRMYASALYKWGMAEGLCDHNPFVNTNNPGLGSKPRERILDDNELKRVFDCLLADDVSTAVRLLAITGLRRDEVGGLRWSEVDLDASMLNIPGTRTKNKRALTLTLPEPVLDILRAIPRRDAPCVFRRPSSRLPELVASQEAIGRTSRRCRRTGAAVDAARFAADVSVRARPARGAAAYCRAGDRPRQQRSRGNIRSLSLRQRDRRRASTLGKSPCDCLERRKRQGRAVRLAKVRCRLSHRRPLNG
jgi:integrase